MPEFFLELFSEEIPARMQAGAANELRRCTQPTFHDLQASAVKTFFGPRRIAISAQVHHEKIQTLTQERGPRETAPQAALVGFLKKHDASSEDIITENGYYVLRKMLPAIPAGEYILRSLPADLAKFSWPKSMRWGQSGDFTWVRPLRRIVCLLDGEVIPIKLGPITASNESEGHRFLSPGAFTVSSEFEWEQRLNIHNVVADAALRRQLIVRGLQDKADPYGLLVVDDVELVEEVTGLAEFPVPLIGRIDEDFMHLPAEVRELSMKINQRYFALRDSASNPAPYFGFISNMQTTDDGAIIVAGNERVLRARLSDARHFWEMDLKTPLDVLLPKLRYTTFHASIGNQFQRAEDISELAGMIASLLIKSERIIEQAEWAGRLCKADLVTEMVGEFPELQGVMGGYYAEKNANGWDGAVVGPAIKTHYQPKGPNDPVPTEIVAVSVALADKLNTLTKFFEIGEKPTGSGDPYALRRAALGVIRIILENGCHLQLRPLINHNDELFEFIIERLRVKLRTEGRRFDVLDAVISIGSDEDLVRIMQRVIAVSDFLLTPEGANLLAAYKRGINILRNEEAKDNCTYTGPIVGELIEPEEIRLAGAIGDQLARALTDPDGKAFADFTTILQGLSKLNQPVNAFLEKVLINDSVKRVRENRLRLLGQLRLAMHQIADFSKIEG